MTNKSGDLGAKAETWTADAFRRRGFPHAERRRPEGEYDRGDLAGMIGITCQVKGGHAAENASVNQVIKWMIDVIRQAAEADRVARKINPGIPDTLAILVCKAKGVGYPNAGQWWAFITDRTYRRIVGVEGYGLDERPGSDKVIMRMTVDDLAWLLRLGGWGEPLPADDQGKIIEGVETIIGAVERS
jgi:hypothetical protein